MFQLPSKAKIFKELMVIHSDKYIDISLKVNIDNGDYQLLANCVDCYEQGYIIGQGYLKPNYDSLQVECMVEFLLQEIDNYYHCIDK